MAIITVYGDNAVRISHRTKQQPWCLQPSGAWRPIAVIRARAQAAREPLTIRVQGSRRSLTEGLLNETSLPQDDAELVAYIRARADALVGQDDLKVMLLALADAT